MTAEVVLMNKQAVALAADSAGTIGGKIFNSNNKPTMAETLVNLTSFKRKISMNQRETVGGPTDVALITKGDGFIWVNRKHYFNSDKNHHFFAKYFKEETSHE